MTPSWYDVLDVAPDATTDEIRAAWRGAVADLDPTDRRFAVLNRAAKVLLDPETRAAHDAELAEQDDAVDPDDEVTPTEAVTSEPTPGDEPAATTAAGAKPATKKPATKKPATKKPATKKPATKKLATKEPGTKHPVAEQTADETAEEREPAGKKAERGTAGSTSTGGVTLAKDGDAEATGARSPLWVALVAGLVAVLLAAVAVAAVVGSTSTDELDEDVTEAQAAAEQAIVPVLSYDATDLEAGRSTALSYLTDDFGQEYAELFDGLIEGNAQEIGAQVQATLLASAVVRTDPEVRRVQVLVFVDQQTTNDQLATPRTDSNQVTVTMERVGDEWLIDDLDTGTAG